KRKLGHRLTRYDGLWALPLVPASKAVHLRSWPSPDSLKKCVALLATKPSRTGCSQPTLLGEGKLGPKVPLPVCERQDPVIKPRNGHPAAVIVKFCDHSAQYRGGICHRSTKDPGVKIRRWTAQPNFQA